MDISDHALLRLTGEGLSLAFWGAPDYEAHFRPDSWMVLSGIPLADLNVVFVGDGEHAEQRLRELDAAVATRALTALYVAHPQVFERLSPVAEKLGLTHAGNLPVMTCDSFTQPAHQSRYHLTRVENFEQLEDVVPLLSAAFSLPVEDCRATCGPALLESHCVNVFIAHRDGQPVSTVMATRHGPIVGICSMATPPEIQGQGAGRAVLEHAMAYHRARGAELFYLGATAAGKPLYEKVGFTTAVDAPVWVSGVSTQMPVQP